MKSKIWNAFKRFTIVSTVALAAGTCINLIRHRDANPNDQSQQGGSEGGITVYRKSKLGLRPSVHPVDSARTRARDIASRFRDRAVNRLATEQIARGNDDAIRQLAVDYVVAKGISPAEIAELQRKRATAIGAYTPRGTDVSHAGYSDGDPFGISSAAAAYRVAQSNGNGITAARQS